MAKLTKKVHDVTASNDVYTVIDEMSTRLQTLEELDFEGLLGQEIDSLEKKMIHLISQNKKV